MYHIPLLLNILILNKCVSSYPVSIYKISYSSRCNSGNYPYSNNYPLSITPVSYHNRFIHSYADGRPIILYDEMAYYGRRRYPTGKFYTYSRRFPVYSSSFTPYLIVQPKLTDISALSPVVSLISTSPSLSLTTKLVALPIKPEQDETFKINLGKESNVDIIYEPNKTTEVNGNADYISNDDTEIKTNDNTTVKTKDHSTVETDSASQYNTANESTKFKTNKALSKSYNQNKAKEIIEYASKSGSLTLDEDNYENSTRQSDIATALDAADKNLDSKTDYVNEFTVTSVPNTSGSESIKETQSKSISGKVVFKGMIPAKGSVKIFKKFS